MTKDEITKMEDRARAARQLIDQIERHEQFLRDIEITPSKFLDGRPVLDPKWSVSLHCVLTGRFKPGDRAQYSGRNHYVSLDLVDMNWVRDLMRREVERLTATLEGL